MRAIERIEQLRDMLDELTDTYCDKCSNIDCDSCPYVIEESDLDD